MIFTSLALNWLLKRWILKLNLINQQIFVFLAFYSVKLLLLWCSFLFWVKILNVVLFIALKIREQPKVIFKKSVVEE